MSSVSSSLPTYKGGLFGVSCTVILYHSSSRAAIALEGVPICGKISGKASFSPSGEVELDADLARDLERRFVRIDSAGENTEDDTVWVKAKLPLALGKHKIILRRCKK